jgi:Tfp pilus assembly protein PilN
MSSHERRPGAGNAPNSFLPEDYLQKKAERRAIGISLFLFLVVGIGIVGAFFVTYRQWSTVKATQEQVNRDFAAEAKKIDQLKVLESQRDELKEKADVTLALVERVPRSILMAELINRMPKQLTLTEFSLKSKRVVEAPKVEKKTTVLAGPQTLAQIKKNQSAAAPTPSGASAAPKPTPPRFDFRLELVGLSSTDDDVADYYQQLVACPLLDRVDMIYSSDTVIEEVPMRKFRIEASIKNLADARSIEPLHVPRLNSRPSVTRRAAPPRNPLDPTVPRDEFPSSPITGVPTNQGKQE